MALARALLCEGGRRGTGLDNREPRRPATSGRALLSPWARAVGRPYGLRWRRLRRGSGRRRGLRGLRCRSRSTLRLARRDSGRERLERLYLVTLFIALLRLAQAEPNLARLEVQHFGVRKVVGIADRLTDRLDALLSDELRLRAFVLVVDLVPNLAVGVFAVNNLPSAF